MHAKNGFGIICASAEDTELFLEVLDHYRWHTEIASFEKSIDYTS
jgi:hypothetical protein